MLKFGIFNWICEKMVLDKKQNAEGKALVCTQVKSIKLLPEKFNFLYVCSAGTSFKNLFYFLRKDLPLKVILWKFDISPTAKCFVRRSDNNCWYQWYSLLALKMISTHINISKYELMCQFHIKLSWLAKYYIMILYHGQWFSIANLTMSSATYWLPTKLFKAPHCPLIYPLGKVIIAYTRPKP